MAFTGGQLGCDQNGPAAVPRDRVTYQFRYALSRIGELPIGVNLSDVVARGREDDPIRRGVAFGVLGLSDVDANPAAAGLV
jgi:hypothetical protein